MAILKNFCCKLSLKDGSYIASVYTVLVSLVSGVICTVVITKDDENEIAITTLSGLVPKAEVFIDSWPSNTVFIVMAALYFVWCIISIVASAGVPKGMKKLLVPWMGCTFLFTFMFMWNIVIFLIEGETTFGDADHIAALILNIFLTSLNVYFCLVVLSYLLEKKKEKIKLKQNNITRVDIENHINGDARYLQHQHSGRPNFHKAIYLSRPQVMQHAKLTAQGPSGTRTPQNLAPKAHSGLLRESVRNSLIMMKLQSDDQFTFS